MKCAQSRRLFGAYWDGDTTQAEKESLESHFVSCPKCRVQYEELAKALEWTASLPRVEAAPEFLERTLASARRAAAIPDRITQTRITWVPVTAAAALLVVSAGLVLPWLGVGLGPRVAGRSHETRAVREARLVGSIPAALQARPSTGTASAPNRAGSATLAAIPDSLFDHSEDFEFVLDPVTLKRGRAAVSRVAPGPRGEQAVITF